MDIGERIENSLQEQIVYLRQLENKSDIVSTVHPQSESIKAINGALELALDEKDDALFLRCIILVEDVIEIYMSFGKEAKNQLIFSIVKKFIDVTCETVSVHCKMELLRTMNILLEGCSSKVAQDLLKMENFNNHLKNLFLQISTSGDFEVQVMLIESLLRLLPQKSHREIFLKNLLSDDVLLSCFLSIRDSHFDVDCRRFLNRFNSTKFSNNRIYSFPILNAKLDGEQIYKPDDEDYDSFWIDFNSGSKRISLFCQSTLLPSQLSQNKEPRWETLSLWANDVKRFNCDGKDKCWVITVELKGNAQMLTNKEPEMTTHLFICHLSKEYDVEEALAVTLKKVKPKSSVPEKYLLLLPQKNKPSSTENSTKFMVQSESKNHDSSLLSSSQNSLSNSISHKSSIPLEPMTIISSSLSSIDGNKCISWQTIHTSMFKNKSKTQCDESNFEAESKTKSKTKLDVTSNPIKSNVKTVFPKTSDFGDHPKKQPPKEESKKISEIQKRIPNDEKYSNETEKNRVHQMIELAADIYQSPITASGDNIPVCQTSRATPLKEKETSPNLLKKKSKKCSAELKDKRADLSLTKEKENADSSSLEANVPLTRQGKNTPEMKTSTLRSGKKISTPVVSRNISQAKYSVKQPITVDKNITPMYNVNDRVNEELTITEKSCQITEPLSIYESRSLDETKRKTFEDAVETKNSEKECESFNSFKQPKSCNVIKSQGRKNNSDFKRQMHGGKIDKSYEKDASHKHNRIKDVVNMIPNSSREENLLKIQLNQASNIELSTASSDSGELYIEKDDSIAVKNQSKTQDFICETQTDELLANTNTIEEKENRNSEHSKLKLSSKTKEYNIDDNTFHNIASKSQGELYDTQESKAAVSSFVFDKKEDRKKYDKLFDKRCATENVHTIPKRKKKIGSSNLQNKQVITNSFHNEIEIRKEKSALSNSYDHVSLNTSLRTNIEFGQETSNHTKVSSERNLRPRNKKVCYLEQESVCDGSSIENTRKKEPEIVHPSRRKFDIAEIPIINRFSSSSNLKEVKKKFLNGMNSKQKNQNVLNKDRKSYQIWRSQEVKTTVTSIPIISYSDCSSSDPYNFDSECQMNLGNVQNFIPYSSNLLQNNNNKENTTSKQSQKDKHRKSKSLSRSTHFQEIYSKDSKKRNSIDPQINKKVQISDKLKGEKHEYKTSLNLKKTTVSQSQSSTFQHHTKLLELQNVSYLPCNKSIQKNVNTPSASEKDDQFYTPNGGIVFPHLEDSIPCTPQFDTNNNTEHLSLYSLGSKSQGTELSWIAKRKTSPTKKDKMRGRTYGQSRYNNSFSKPEVYDDKDYICHPSSNDGLKNDRHNKEASSGDSETELHYNKRTKKKRKKNNSDITFDTTLSPPDWIKSREENKRKKSKEMNKTLSSGQPTRTESGSSSNDANETTAKRRLSFEGRQKEKRWYQARSTVNDKDFQSTEHCLTSFRQPWNCISPHITKIQNANDNIPECKEVFNKNFLSFSYRKSGPSSVSRLDNSTLKRKYPSVSSDSVEKISCSDSTPEKKSSKIVRKKLFDSGTTLSTRNRTKNEFHHKNSDAASDGNLSNPDKNKISPENCLYDPSIIYFKTNNHRLKSICNQSKSKYNLTPKNATNDKSFNNAFSSGDLLNKRLLPLSSSPEMDFENRIDENKNIEILGKKYPRISPCNALLSPTCSDSMKSSQLLSSSGDHEKKARKSSLHDEDEFQTTLDDDPIELMDTQKDHDSSCASLNDFIQNKEPSNLVPSESTCTSESAQEVLKITRSIMKTSLTERKGKRTKAIKKFNLCLQSVMKKTEKFSQEAKETEVKMMLLFAQQMQKLKSHREFSKQSLDSIKCACQELMNETDDTHKKQIQIKKSVKEALKQDFDTLAKAIKNRFNQYSLEAMKRCLLASFMLT